MRKHDAAEDTGGGRWQVEETEGIVLSGGGIVAGVDDPDSAIDADGEDVILLRAGIAVRSGDEVSGSREAGDGVEAGASLGDGDSCWQVAGEDGAVSGNNRTSEAIGQGEVGRRSAGGFLRGGGI